MPTLLLTGFLGAGKTTLLGGWLAARPAHERWAVLVNEFGALGVDRALLGGDAPGAEAAVAVAEVAGGCACCAARVAFAATLTRLLRRGPWDRLFIETTGLGHPAALVDQLRAAPFAGLLRLLPPVAVVDATRAALYVDPARPGHRIALDQVSLARLLVLNRVSGVSGPTGASGPAGALDDDARALATRLADAPPWSRPVLPTTTGRVPLAAVLAALDEDVATFAAGPSRPPVDVAFTPDAAPVATLALAPVPTPALAAALTHEPPRPMRWRRTDGGAAASGWWWPGTAAFDRAGLQAALEMMSAPGGPLRAHGLLRAKGVFRTARAWYAWQWVEGRSDWQETAWRADSRLELLALREVDPEMVENPLRMAAWKG